MKDFKSEVYNEEGATIKEANQVGYSNVISSITEMELLYNTGKHYWISSPCNYRDFHEKYLSNKGYVASTSHGDAAVGFRPVVCLPASAIEVVGEGDSAVLNYK